MTIRYSEQFKQEAMRLVREEGYSKKAAAEAVGICPTTLAGWLRREADQRPVEMVYASPEDELKSLRKEVVRLRMERDILKKATAYFAQENQS
ncbi:MAG: transposase [Acidimicrobiia bacterium]|nr:transposase [Acidimicrobiia bacterium]